MTIDVTGQRFGRLLAVERRGVDKSRAAAWLCRCDCGSTVVVSGYKLRDGNNKSCGCMRREMARAQSIARNAARGISTYRGAHRHVDTVRGKARTLACVDCGATAFDWSYDLKDPNQVVDTAGLAYSLDPDHYDPRCRSCHRLHDNHHFG